MVLTSDKKMKLKLITIMVLLMLPFITASVYELEVDYTDFQNNSQTSISAVELDYNHFNAFPIEYGLYNNCDDSYLGTVVFDGDFIGNYTDGVFYGELTINNDTEFPVDIQNPYKAVCVAENNSVGCIISNEEGFNVKGYILGGSINETSLYISGYQEFNAMIGQGEFNTINMQGNISGFLNNYMTIGYGSNISLYNINGLTNANFDGVCYYINNESIYTMDNIRCLVLFNEYIDYDQDGFTSDLDCNDNNNIINPSIIETAYNTLDDDCNILTLDDDIDQDGYILVNDCDDTNSSINPNIMELNDNSIDENCDAIIGTTPVVASGGSGGGGGGSGGSSDNHPTLKSNPIVNTYEPIIEEQKIPEVTETTKENEITGAVVQETSNGNLFVVLVLGGLAILGIGFFIWKKYY